jgi:hypothetical protein
MMYFAAIDNPFGTLVTEPTVASQPTAVYYHGLKLERRPVRIPRAPKPLSHHLKNFLLNF